MVTAAAVAAVLVGAVAMVWAAGVPADSPPAGTPTRPAVAGSASPPVSAGPPPAGLKTFTEQQGRFGVSTFNDPFNPSVTGVRIAPYQRVEVSCKVYSPVFDSLKPDGYWYRIASSPWNNQWYAAANTFMHGETSPPWKVFTDVRVPDCA